MAPVLDGEQLRKAIEAQERLRGVIPDDVVDVAVAALRTQLAALDDRPTLGAEAQRRRQVTVLFADVSGYTAMASDADPETVAARMNDVWARLDDVITKHGGRVDKHIGDAVMAVWGTSTTREDDPERAVVAGLAMQQEVERRAAVDGLRMRVGINTGSAHLGAVGTTAEFTAIGDTVNVASRLQNAAPLGGVLVTHDTYRHIRGVFDVDALEPVRVKGKADPLRVYSVRRAKSRAFRLQTRGVEGVETQMVGREAQLDSLRAEFEETMVKSELRLVTITGDAGIGKSRLLYEFENLVELHPQPAYYFRGRALPARQEVTFGLLRDVVGDRFGVLDSDPPATVASKVHTGFAPALAADAADVVAHWLGFDRSSSDAVRVLLDSENLAATARAHFFEYLRALASDSPVVMLLEDLHWADDDSLQLVRDLTGPLAAAPMLVVGVARPALGDRPAGAELLAASHVTLHLDPLDAAATKTLVKDVLQKAAEVPESVVDLIAQRAEGNAFHVEELVKMLVDDGVIETGEPWDPWVIEAGRLDADRVPATLTGVLQSRIDSLEPRDRVTLQRSSVVGRIFWDGAVTSLGEDSPDATATSLEHVRQREFVFRRDPSSFEDNVEYTFKHALLRDVTYETVLLRDRQRLHSLVARWITEKAGDRLGEYASLVATHHRLAGEPKSAAELLARAGRALHDAGNTEAARRTLNDAMELWREAGTEPTVDAVIALASASIRHGDLDTAASAASAALDRAATAEERVGAHYVASWLASERNDHDRELALLEDARAEAEQVGGLLLVKILCGLGWAHAAVDDWTATRRDIHRAHAVAGDLDLPAARRLSIAAMAFVAGMTGDLAESLRWADEHLRLAEESGDLDGQAIAHLNLGVARHLSADGGADVVRNYGRALAHYHEASLVNRRLGRALAEGLCEANIAQVHVRRGDDATARRHMLSSLRALRGRGPHANQLFAILAEADRRLAIADTSGGLALLGYVRGVPGVGTNETGEVERILGRLDLPAADVERGLAAMSSANETLDDVIDRLIEELESAPGELD